MDSIADKASFRDRRKSGDLFPPIFVKELRQGLRANQFVWPFILVQIAAIACVAVEFFASVVSGSGGGSGDGYLFYGFLGIVFWGVLPLTLFGALQPELSAGRNVELLLMSNLTRWEIVLGKWSVGSVLSMLMLISLLPYAMFRYMIGYISDFTQESLWLGGIIAGNAVVNAIVIGASGFRNYVGRAAMIVLSVGCGVGSCAAVVVGPSSGSVSFIWYFISGIVIATLLIALNLQLGRAKLRLFENPLDPPSSALIIILILCAPIIIVIARVAITMTGLDIGGIAMSIVLLVLTLLIDPGPGKKNRKWAQA